VPNLAFKKAKLELVILSSVETIKELSLTLIKKKFNKYVDIETRLEFLFEFKEISKIIQIAHTVELCRDPKDNMYLELALSGKADLIITGDTNLLILHPFCNIPNITPELFIDNF